MIIRMDNSQIKSILKSKIMLKWKFIMKLFIDWLNGWIMDGWKAYFNK